MKNLIDSLHKLLIIGDIAYFLFIELTDLYLASAIRAARRARHKLHVVVLALALLYLPHYILYISKSVSLREFEKHGAFLALSFRFGSQNYLSEVFIFALYVFKLLVIRYDVHALRIEQLALRPPENVF